MKSDRTGPHKLLERQIRKYLPDADPEDHRLKKFIAAVNDSYLSFERDKELWTHAFNISELEYKEMNENLTREHDMKKVSLEKLKDSLRHIAEDEALPVSDDTENLIGIVDYLNQQITKRKEAELELKRLSLVASANTNGVLLTDKAGRIFWSNEGYEKLTMHSQRDLIGKRPTDVARGPMSDEEMVKQMIGAYAAGKSFSIEVAYYRKDKSWFWARVKGQPILDINKKVVQYFSIIEDITQEKSQAEQIQRLSLVASANSKGVFMLDGDLKLTWANPAYATITGYTLDELIGNSPMQLFMKDRRDPVLMARMILKDRDGENFTEEFIHNRKNGSVFWARLNMQFVTEKDGKIMNRFGVLEDITKEKDAENILKLREEKYRNIIANMNLGLIEVDNNDFIQYVNQSFIEMSGYDHDELIGKRAAELFIAGENLEVIREKNAKRRQGESDAYEIAVRNKRGELKYWLISGAPRVNDNNEVIGSIGIHLDITEQKRQEYELIDARKRAEESSKAKETFLANMSHEIRTPLNAIIGMLRELGKQSLSPKQQAYLHNADTASRHLLSIINNILDISKIDAGEFHLENRHFDLHETINETVSIISNQALEKLLKLRVKVTGELKPALIGDPSRIRQILINILGNAIKFTEKGSIVIECKAGPPQNNYRQQIQLTVTDTGVGMDESYLEDNNLFKKFSQEDHSTARKYGGTGLGMAITYELVQLMGGTIEVTSKKGKGTSIKITFTLKIGDVELIERNVSHYNFNDLNGLRVLLAEDNEMNRIVAINTLSYFGLHTTEVETGKAAVEKLRTETFDVVLMDLHMPEMDGIEATKIIRNELGSTVPVIALTANAFKKELDMCIAAGMNDYVTKPFEEPLLLGSILKNVEEATGKRKPSESTVSNIEPVKLYDLSKLKEASRGNQMFVMKMAGLFVTQSETCMQQVKEAFAGNDFKTIRDLAHRFKPSIDNMGIGSIREEIRELEKLAEEGVFSDRLARLIATIDETITSVNLQLKNDLPDLIL